MILGVDFSHCLGGLGLPAFDFLEAKFYLTFLKKFLIKKNFFFQYF